jgi:release factor glutamine methyltransferase
MCSPRHDAAISLESFMQVHETLTVATSLARAIAQLGPDVRLEAEILLAHALDRPRAWLYAHADEIVSDDARTRFDVLLARRALGVPIAQLIGKQGFWSLELRITPDVLIPRADTELLVECALAVLPLDKPMRIADLGTGSGAIALAIASERPLAKIVAVDSSIAALDVARSNAKALAFLSREQCAVQDGTSVSRGRMPIEIVHGDWFAPLHGQCFDVIVSNPPYLAADDPHLDRGDLRFEPRAALASGSDGLDAIRTIAGSAPTHLLAGGWLLLEHGWEQGAAVRALLAGSGFMEIATHRDIEARERVTCGRWRG